VEVIDRLVGAPELAAFYRSAIGFVFPSLRETFGMPMLEAMSCGCPVITSTETACPEIAAQAALMVNPRSVDEIHSALNRLIADV
jgi:glycosyltransferase involved in cell wall biosynthesis